MSNLDAALALAKRGFAVFPCWENRKTPVTKSGFKEATTDPEIVAAWWTGYPKANVAVATGAKSGRFVLDADMQCGRDGEGSLRKLEEKYGPLPATVTSITPCGGLHRWFNAPPGRLVPSKSGVIAPHLDTRGDGGYALVPPSYAIEKEKGYEGPYLWDETRPSVCADMPPAWLDLICGDDKKKREPKPTGYFSELAEGVPEGSRNESLAQIIGALIRAGMTGRQAYDYGIYWNERNTPPLDEKRIGQCVLNIQKREKKRLAKWKK
jgi:putative DNA primase/helicase